MNDGFETFDAGPAGIASFDQLRAEAAEFLRAAQQCFIVFTIDKDETGEMVWHYRTGLNPNDRDEMTIGVVADIGSTALRCVGATFQMAVKAAIERNDEEAA